MIVSLLFINYSFNPKLFNFRFINTVYGIMNIKLINKAYNGDINVRIKRIL